MAPKAKPAANGNANKAAKGSGSTPTAGKSPTASGTATPVSKVEEDVKAGGARAGRPDKAVYDAEQEKYKKEIEGLQIKLKTVQDKINSLSGNGPANERRNELRAELDQLRNSQQGFRNSRGRIVEQLKSLNEGIQKKIKDLQAAKTKTPFKSVAEIDAHIKQLDKQVESGNMKLADEKRALQEISQSKRSRRVVEGFQAEQDAIEKDRSTAEELRRQLDDPEAKAASERMDAIKAELDEIRKEGDEAHSNRSKLFDERTAIKTELDEAYRQKRESSIRNKEENDRYWAKINEDRARRQEKLRAQRAAEEDQKKKEQATRLREEAAAPAFQSQIEDCQTLIDFLSGKSTVLPSSSDSLLTKAELVGVPKLDIRKVDDEVATGLIVRKKKGQDNDDYFVANKGKGKGKKGGNNTKAVNGNGSAATEAVTPTATTNDRLNVPLPTLTALLSLSIPPPASKDDVPRTIEDLKTKKAWFEANQTRVTAENIAKAEAEIQRLLKSSAKDAASPSAADGESSPKETVEDPPEPTSTPATDGVLAAGVPTEEIDEKLEPVAESTAVEA